MQSTCRFCDKFFFFKKTFLTLPGKNKTVVRVISRTSSSQTFFKIGVLKNFVIFTGKHLCWSLVFDKVAGVFKFQHRCFLWILRTFLRAPFFYRVRPGGCFWIKVLLFTLLNQELKLCFTFFPPKLYFLRIKNQRKIDLYGNHYYSNWAV